MRERHQKYRVELRAQIFEDLGGVCVQCGYNNPLALEIDHIDGGGSAERKGKNYLQYYRAIIKRGLEGLQLLCANCHTVKTREQLWES